MQARRQKTLRIGVAALVGSLILTTLVATSATAVSTLTTIAMSAGGVRTAFAPDGLTAYVSNDTADTVSVIDVPSYTTLGTIAVGDTPYGLEVSPNGAEVYVVNFGASSVSVIDTLTATSVATIPVQNLPYDVEFSADGAKAYVANYGAHSVSVIDVVTRTVTATIPTVGQPQGIALSPDGTFLYVTGVTAPNLIYKIDVATDAVVDTISDASFLWTDSVVFTPDGLFAYASNNTGDSISVIDVVLGNVIYVIPDINGIQYLDISRDGSTIYATSSDVGAPSDGMTVIDVASNTVSSHLSFGSNPYSAVVSPDGNLIYVADQAAATVTVFGEVVTRTSGTDRYKTAVAVSQAAFPAGADYVFVATAANFPDALSAGPAAAGLGGPLLLTASTSIPAAVKAEIERLDPVQIIVIGGTGVVSTEVFNELNTLATSGAYRIFGANRYETSREIADQTFGPGGGPEVYIATGRNFPDALGASAVGAAYGRPVILVDGNAASVDQATLDLLTLLGTTNVRIAGGTGVVSAGIETQLDALYTVTRLGGATRYDTSNIINSDGYPLPGDATRVFLATGVNFPDALSGSAWAGRIGAPLFIVPGTCIPADILDKIIDLGVFQVTLIGGTGVVTQAVFDLTECA